MSSASLPAIGVLVCGWEGRCEKGRMLERDEQVLLR